MGVKFKSYYKKKSLSESKKQIICEDDHDKIRELSKTIKLVELAKMFGVSQSRISHIVSGRIRYAI